MEFKLSEYGNHTLFNSLNKAIKYCRENNLTDGEHCRLWLICKNRKEADEWYKTNHSKLKDYMILSYYRGEKTFVFDDLYNEWHESKKYWAMCKIIADRLEKIITDYDTTRICNKNI